MNKNLMLTATASLLVVTSALNAQTVVRETKTTVQPTEIVGTVTEFVPAAPATVVVRTTESAEPVRYTFTKTTEYVDESGNRISEEILKSGLPVKIVYVKQGDRMVVSRVIARKQVTTTTVPAEPVIKKKTTTTTTTTKDKEEEDDKD